MGISQCITDNWMSKGEIKAKQTDPTITKHVPRLYAVSDGLKIVVVAPVEQDIYHTEGEYLKGLVLYMEKIEHLPCARFLYLLVNPYWIFHRKSYKIRNSTSLYRSMRHISPIFAKKTYDDKRESRMVRKLNLYYYEMIQIIYNFAEK